MSCLISASTGPDWLRAQCAAPSSARSRVSRLTGGPSRHSSRGLAASARATPTSFALSHGQAAGIAPRPSPCRPGRAVLKRPGPELSLDATVRFSHVQVANSPGLRQVRPSLGGGAHRRQPADVRPGQFHPAKTLTKPEIRVDSGLPRLPIRRPQPSLADRHRDVAPRRRRRRTGR